MNVSGDDAARYDAVHLKDCKTINTGTLTSANEETGYVTWLDRAGEARHVTLGPHAISICPRSPYHR